MAERDYAFEALAEVTSTDWNAGRGELNLALRLIREQEPDLADDNFMLAEVIRARAKMYRAVFGIEITLTPTALAKHWLRVFEESEARSSKARTTNQPAPDVECSTCGGDRFVLVGTIPAVTTAWMEEHGIKAPDGAATETYAACPSCNPTDTSFWRGDGSRSRALDPEKVRELMGR